MLKFLSTLLASLSLFAGAAAHATPAQSLSLTNAPARASTAPGASNAQSELGAGIYVIGAIAVGLAVWGIIELTSDDDDPDSP